MWDTDRKSRDPMGLGQPVHAVYPMKDARSFGALLDSGYIVSM